MVMIEQFQATPMDWDCARAAYPLVRMHDAGVTLEQWLRFSRRRCGTKSGRSGLIAIRDRRGIVHALFSHRADVDMHGRKRLCLTNLIVAHLPGSQIDVAVAASARELAVRLGCQNITVEQPFRTMSSAHPGCPTAEALKQRHRLPGQSRVH